MSNDVEFFNDDANLSRRTRVLKPPFDDTPSFFIRLLLKTGIIKTRAIAAGIVIGTSIFFLSTAIVVSINIVLSPTSRYIQEKYPVVPISDQVSDVQI